MFGVDRSSLGSRLVYANKPQFPFVMEASQSRSKSLIFRLARWQWSLGSKFERLSLLLSSSSCVTSSFIPTISLFSVSFILRFGGRPQVLGCDVQDALRPSSTTSATANRRAAMCLQVACTLWEKKNKKGKDLFTKRIYSTHSFYCHHKVTKTCYENYFFIQKC